MSAGKVKWFNDKKGYGFIIPDAGGDDIFVHHTGILGEGFRTLTEGERIEFELEQGKKGMVAVKVKRLGKP